MSTDIKPGDRVRVIADYFNEPFEYGSIHTVRSIGDDDPDGHPYVNVEYLGFRDGFPLSRGEVEVFA